jgi:pimeloyl-ACP methyl ester carboxylesterase
MWDPVRRHLDPACDVVTVDLPGHGSRTDRYTLEGARKVIAEAARSVAPAPVILAGDSLGAYSSMAAASAIPKDQLKGLVLGGSTFQFVGPSVIPYVLKGALLGVLAKVFGDQKLSDRLMPKVLMGEFKLDPADAKAMMDAKIRSSAFGHAVQALRGIDFRAILAAIPQPTLLVNGEGDTVNVRQEQSFLEVARDGRTHRLGCKHGVSLWHPKEFAGLINAFARQVLHESKAARAAAP